MSENGEDVTRLQLGSKIKYEHVDEVVEQFKSAKHWAVQVAVLAVKAWSAFVWSRAIVEIVRFVVQGALGGAFIF